MSIDLPNGDRRLSESAARTVSATISLIGRVLILFGVALLARSTAVADQFIATAGMSRARTGHTATRLRDGRVLIAGGSNSGIPTSTAEAYDPALGRFVITGAMTEARARAAATLLADGRVLISGGIGTSKALATADVYDPSTGQFTATYGPMSYARLDHSSTLLLDGRVLITGGAPEGHRDEAELYDPTSSTFLPLPKMLTDRTSPLSFTLPNGNALIISGNFPSTTPGAEYFNTRTGRFEQAAARTLFSRGLEAAAQLPTTEILIAAGAQDPTGIGGKSEIFDPRFATFISVNAMITPRRAHAATLLDDGRVLLSGGEVFNANQTGTQSTDSTEFFDLGSRAFRPGPRMVVARQSHTATKLFSGSVLIVGGIVYPSLQALSTAEIFVPDPRPRKRAVRH